MVDFVAGTQIRHGNEDGSVDVIQPGEDLQAGDLPDDREALRELISAGAIVVKGSPQDPNTWQVDTYADTTPAMIEDALLAQVADIEAGLKVHPDKLTQPGAEAHDDPRSLLVGEQVPDQKDLVMPQPQAGGVAAGPTTVTAQALQANQQSARDANTDGAEGPEAEEEPEAKEEPAKKTAEPKNTTEAKQ